MKREIHSINVQVKQLSFVLTGSGCWFPVSFVDTFVDIATEIASSYKLSFGHCIKIFNGINSLVLISSLTC